MMPADFPRRFHALLEGMRDVVLTTHINPDGDALGSELGLGAYLLARGARVRIVNHDPVPALLRRLERPELPIECYESELHDAALERAELVVLLDNSAPDRLGRMERPMRAVAARVLCIDHHPIRDVPWAHTLVDTGVCATAELVHDLIRADGYRLDRAAAEALYVGIATDTGFFRFNSTTARAHEIAAELLRAGVEPAPIYGEICERNSVAFTRLLGHALAELRLDAGGAIASVRLDEALVQRLGAQHEDAAEITTALLAIDGVRMAVLFRELGAGRIKVSLRSKGELDVHRLATEFGGGGHRNASGIVITGRLPAVAERVLERAGALVAETS